MHKVIIGDKEAEQRLDKFLNKYLKEAPSGFVYKMLRKKNIILNGAKATGSEKLKAGDDIRFFLAEETIGKFRNICGHTAMTEEYRRAFETYGDLMVLYETQHMLVVNKPAGMLTQKAEASDLSLNEWLIGYLLDRRQITAAELMLFKPSVCNRLDRNTSGMVLCGKTLKGSQTIAALLKDRSLHKYYRLIVVGTVTKGALLEGYLTKDAQKNKVTITKESRGNSDSYIQTRYEPIARHRDITLLEAELITGKTHQIRAHLASIGHPLLGDAKYGSRETNNRYRKHFGISSQLLHCYRLEFPTLYDDFTALSGLVLTADMPEIYLALMKES